MKKILSAIQAALDKIDSFADRRPALETERQELTAKIQELTNAVSRGDAKAINALAIAKARLEVLPDEMKGIADAHAALIGELKELISSISPALAKIRSRTFSEIEETVRKFLEKHLENGHQVNEIIRQITTHSREVADLDKFLNVYSGIYGFNQTDSGLLFSRARYALDNLKKYE